MREGKTEIEKQQQQQHHTIILCYVINAVGHLSHNLSSDTENFVAVVVVDYSVHACK